MRPIAFPNDPKVIVSPTDSRVLVFKEVPEDQKVIKNKDNFSHINILLARPLPVLPPPQALTPQHSNLNQQLDIECISCCNLASPSQFQACY